MMSLSTNLTKSVFRAKKECSFNLTASVAINLSDVQKQIVRDQRFVDRIHIDSMTRGSGWKSNNRI